MKKVTSIFYIFLLFTSFSFFACQDDYAHVSIETDEYSSLFLEILAVENAIYQENDASAKIHLDGVEEILKSNYNMFCLYESAEIDGARMTAYLLKNHLGKAGKDELLDDLRILKAQIITLETDEDYDPYLSFLWQFEEEMYLTTSTAIDPMLGLYEWNEFEVFVDCMNERWEVVKMHYPSPELFGYDELMYKNQTSKKLLLQTSIDNFNKAVNTDDWENYSLCDSAEQVRTSYIEYIQSFLPKSLEGTSFLA